MTEAFQIAYPDPEVPFTIGRKQENSLCIQDMLVSRQHAVIEYCEGKWFLKNLTQNSITELNDAPIDEAEINDGDVIHIGPHQLRAIMKDGRLSLIVLELNDIPLQAQLSENWETVPLGESENRFEKTKVRVADSKGELLLPHSVTDETGKRLKRITLKNGEHVRFPWSDISYRDGILYSQKAPVGYDVHVKDLEVRAGKKTLLKDINFDLPAGEILAIIGQSGQGKSTLLRLLEGLHRVQKGSEVRIGGIDYRNKDVRQRIAILPQDPELRKDLTVRETLVNGGRVSMDKKDFCEKAQGRLEKFAELFGLSARLDNRVATLSGGEARRAALAQELMGTPGLILLDEPLSGLDPYNSKILCNHLKQLAFLGHTVILTTHSYEALRIANKVLLLHRGRQGFFGTTQGAFQYFKTNDAEEILNNLDDKTNDRWEKSGTKLSSAEATHYSHYYFPRTKRPASFFYTLGLSAKQWARDKGKLAAMLLQPVIIGFLLSQIFSKQTPLGIAAFALILCANWFALSLSIREIVQEKKILASEFRKGSGIFAVVSAKMGLPFIAALLQIGITYACCAFRLATQPSVALVAAAFACTVAPAVAIGIMVSSLAKNAGQANAFLPLLIIPQVALAGALVPLDQMQQIGRALSAVIWSRYNQASLLNVFLERKDDILNIVAPLALAAGFYIIAILILTYSKRAK
ncbi:ATP-binding cassette domain-containing protein [uncultured Fibrobacter sp.]|uniref:ATP-binding cassette domain-containing protein n=1 Tax=uncultured Fibrobacter sp. TaxID=261512 RepID=UPI0025F9B782|nr:ATP-binding cassette domain-containing protein [uncultured Fibrobacter sp.]